MFYPWFYPCMHSFLLNKPKTSCEKVHVIVNLKAVEAWADPGVNLTGAKAKPPQDGWGGGEAPERHGGPGAESPENFLGSTPFKFAEHITTPFIFLQIFRQLIAIPLRLFRIWTAQEWEDSVNYLFDE